MPRKATYTPEKLEELGLEASRRHRAAVLQGDETAALSCTCPLCSFVISVVRALQHRLARYLGPEAFPDGSPAGLQLFANTKVLFEWRLSRGDITEKASEATVTVNHAVARGVPLPKSFGGRLATVSADAMHRLAAEAATAASADSSVNSLGLAVSCEYPSCRHYVQASCC